MTDTLLNTVGLFCWRLDTTHATDNGDAIYARPFGTETCDLDIDFSTLDPRPILVTQLLGCCLRSPNGQYLPEEDIWGWTLTRRLQGLLAIVTATEGERILVPVQCPRTSCRERMELELDLTAFRHPDDGEHFVCAPERDMTLKVRLPTGLDQMNWCRSASGHNGDWAADMAAEMVTKVNDAPPDKGWRLPGAWVPHIESVLREHDPYTEMTVQAVCPHCGHRAPFDMDLEGYAIGMLSAVQQSVMDDIHRLAGAYHWSEKSILALSSNRRQYYLKRILEGAL